MKTISIQVAFTLILMVGWGTSARASETALRVVYQPLDGYGAGRPLIMAVPYVQHFYDLWLGMDKITGTWVPMTDTPDKPVENINLAARIGLKMTFEELTVSPTEIRVTIDCSEVLPEKPGGYEVLEIFSATLECLRLMRPAEPAKIEYAIQTRPSGQEPLAARFAEFLKHPKDQPFYGHY